MKIRDQQMDSDSAARNLPRSMLFRLHLFA
jgi:hypothetical protein